MNSDQKRCPMCDGVASRESVPGYHNANRWTCQHCGEFIADDVDLARYDKWLENERRTKGHRLSALARELHLEFGKPLLILPESPSEALREAVSKAFAAAYPISFKELLGRWPRSVPDLLSRALLSLSRLPDPIRGRWRPLAYYPVLLSASDDEGMATAHLLGDLGYVEWGKDTEDQPTIRVTAKGWERVSELTTTRSNPQNPAFVAMWFDKDIQAAYREGIEPAVRGAGYKATRVDLEPHNEYIMDKVLSLIRVAPFVVAEFAGNRNGVYYEAGYAKGRGIPVIHCCREADAKRAHFDIQQLNQIRWNTVEELRERLRDRILATVGEGPYPPAGPAEVPG